MAYKRNDEPLAPTMQRTKIQLESAYAPGALFTFEGNLVVCESLPKDDYRSASVTQYAEIQILNNIEERINAWFTSGMHSENEPQAFMCVDKSLLNADRSGLNEIFPRTKFGFAEPVEMGYMPTLLSMVCNRCKLVKTFSTLNDFDKRQKELSPSHCTSKELNNECHWRQMDIIFIHPNGNYLPPEPWIYDYNEAINGVIKTQTSCSQCGKTDVRIEEKSAQIGKRYYYCAHCNMKRGREDRWLQNDKEWLEQFRGSSTRPIADIRMKPISYRSNSVHYPMQDMVIDFGKSDRLKALTDTNPHSLILATAERFNLPTIKQNPESIQKTVIEIRGNKEWENYASLKKSITTMEALKGQLPQSEHTDLDTSIVALQEKAKNIEAQWQQDGLIPSEVELPQQLLVNLQERRDRFSGRYDPFRLLIEHQTLLDRIVSDQQMENGLRYFTRMDHLDEYIGPDSEEQMAQLNTQHRKIMDDIGIEVMGLARKFETLQYSYGYSRVDAKPTTRYINNREMPVRLKLFNKTRIDDERKHPIFVLKQNNEAIYVRLNEAAVREWLVRLNTEELITDAPIGQQYLENAPPMGEFLDSLPNPNSPSMSLAVYTLLHSYAHHIMIGISEYSGLGVGSLGEYIFPADLAFIIYRRGMTMDLGNLTSMLRNNAPSILEYIRNPRNLGCGSGSLCLSRGGACPDCLLIPEVSCITQNNLLSRTVLIGKEHPQKYGFHKPIDGFLSVAKDVRALALRT